MQLRDYQQEAVNSIWEFFQRGGKNPVVVMPTGTGKSLVIAGFLKSVFEHYPNQKVLVLTHVKELIQQNFEKLKVLWPYAPAGIYSAGLKKKNAKMSITFAGIQSVAKKSALFGHVDLVIVDEAHLVSPAGSTMYQNFIGELTAVNPMLKVIGLTATPYRLTHGMITEPTTIKGQTVDSLFTEICFDISNLESFNRLIAMGYLAPLIPKSTSIKLDVDGVHMRGGDFVAKELQLAVDRDDITMSAVREAMELGWNRQHWLVFCAGVEHANNTCDMLNMMGVPAVSIHSKMKSSERDEAIRSFKSGEVRAAVNNNVLTTGFDFPSIDLILCLRPTQSVGLWVQMMGRGTRPTDGKENCLVLDFANNTKRLGPINDPLIPSSKGGGTGLAPVKECPCCLTWVHASVRYCTGLLTTGSQCDFEFAFETTLIQEASTRELIKGDSPVVETIPVDCISYALHQKQGKPPSIRVTYHAGLTRFTEYVCLEHEGYAAKRARDWWRERSPEMPIPSSTAQALSYISYLPAATHLRVWVNKKYPEILTYCFDGTAFGTQPATGKQTQVLKTGLKFATFEDIGYGHGGPSHGFMQSCRQEDDLIQQGTVDDLPF